MPNKQNSPYDIVPFTFSKSFEAREGEMTGCTKEAQLTAQQSLGV